MPYRREPKYLGKDIIKVLRKFHHNVGRRKRKPDLVPFAKPAVLEPPKNYTTTYIPEYLETHHREAPEQRAERTLDIDNVIDVPTDVIDDVKDISSGLTEEVKRILLNEGASFLISFDDASSYTEVALRDGMGIEVEIDSSIPKGITQLIRLSVLNKYIENISLPKKVKNKFMSVLTEKIAEDTLLAMQKTSTSDKYSSLLRNLQARVGGKYSDNVGHSNPVGVVKRRSVNNKYAPDDNSSSEEIHDYNDNQNRGVRLVK